MTRLHLFPLLAVACLAVGAFISPSAALAAPFAAFALKVAVIDLASPALERLSQEMRALTGSTVPMRVPGMPAAERSGARVSMLNGPILAPVRGFEIRPLIC